MRRIAESSPTAVSSPGAYQAIHYLAEGETLGAIAARYQTPLEALVLANRLEQGDALVVGQALRIPRVSGFPHVVAAGETVFDLAARFGVPYEAIVAFPPNRIDAGGGLTAGSEIFIRGATRSRLMRSPRSAAARASRRACS